MGNFIIFEKWILIRSIFGIRWFESIWILIYMSKSCCFNIYLRITLELNSIQTFYICPCEINVYRRWWYDIIILTKWRRLSFCCFFFYCFMNKININDQLIPTNWLNHNWMPNFRRNMKQNVTITKRFCWKKNKRFLSIIRNVLLF